MQADPNLGGGRLLEAPPVCDKCGAPGTPEMPIYAVPPGMGLDGMSYCADCTRVLAEGILVGHNRADRRAGARRTRRKGDRKRKRNKR